ncbi:mycothiol synthase [Tessaracoccus sp. MC1756]|uniref:mycothiol synthase n=1 Tax=Tessaracoccus sp. MC1756 TaxID=2760311 RepID=UPI001602B1EA|nr:mycothiol synthase [Tessaracoccus sp. MC1756]
MLVSLTTLTPTMRDALRGLVDAITEHDGISPVNESGSLGIDGVREADFFFMGKRKDPYGFVVCDERDGTLLVGVHPDHRREGIGTELLTEALRAHPESSAWAFGTLPGAPELASRVGMRAVRSLLRMESRADYSQPITGPLPDGYTLDTFTPADREQVVAVNAAAFAHHPEQGRLTVAEFDDLTRQPWFDPRGLFVARQDGDVVGFHWTKRHGGGLGEVYVMAVAPEHEGRGLGRVLLEAGLQHLARQGDDRIQLYVEGNQERVVAMYRKAGFEIVQTDTSFHAERTPA